MGDIFLAYYIFPDSCVWLITFKNSFKAFTPWVPKYWMKIEHVKCWWNLQQGFNYNNILRAAFLTILGGKKLQTEIVIREKLYKTIVYKNAANKMLVKLTSVW